MKKMTIISMMALLVLCASCKKDKEQNTENSSVCFSATVENHSANGKTILNGNQVLWEKGNLITVTSSTSGTPVTFTAGNDGAKAKFYAESVDDNFVKPNSVYTACYGNIAGNTLTLPSSQTYVANSFGSGENPMAAVSAAGETKLPFKNICGFLELKLYASTACEVSSITLKQTGAKLWGTGEVSISGGIPSLGALSGGSDELTLNCGNIPLSTKESQPTTFHFVVPAGTLGGSFTVTMTTKDGAVWSKTAQGQAAIARNDMKSLTTLKADPAQPIPTGALSGLFSVSATKKVYFSKGNLWYDKSPDDNKSFWGFEANQYDFRTYSGKGSCLNGSYNTSSGTPTDTYGLFGWGDVPNNSSMIKTSTDYHDYTWSVDWGTKIGDGSTWRTLTGGPNEEWEYLIDKRTGDKAPEINGKDDCRCAMVKVNSVPGLMVFPDVFTWPASVTTFPTTFNTCVSSWSKVKNYSVTDFAALEAAGVVFLPAAGYRDNSKDPFIIDVGGSVCYQSQNKFSDSRVYIIDVYAGSFDACNDTKIHKGFCVRLVAEKKN